MCIRDRPTVVGPMFVLISVLRAGSGLVQCWFRAGSGWFNASIAAATAIIHKGTAYHFIGCSCCVEPVGGYGLGHSPEWAQLPTVVGPMFVLISVLRAGPGLVHGWFRAVSCWFNASIAAAKAILHKGTACHFIGCSCLLYTSPSPRDYAASRMPSSA